MALLAAAAASHAAVPDRLGESGYLLREWSIADGLPENSANAIAQSRDGYLWIATWKGLARYNGGKFRIFDPANTPELPNAAIVNLHVDKRDRLWVSTSSGLVVKDGTWWRALGVGEGWAGNHVRTFAERANGDLLMTTFDGHVLEFAGGRLSELPQPPGEQGQGYLGAVDESGRWWLAQNRFVGYWDGGQYVRVLELDASVGRSQVLCANARDGGVWILGEKVLRKFRNGNEVSRATLPALRGGLWSLVEDSLSNLWISSYDNGLFQLSAGGSLRHWTKTDGLGTHAMRVAFEDREANLWLGSSGDGLLRLTRQRFELVATGLVSPQARALAPARTGGMWMSFYNGGLRRHDGTSAQGVAVPGPDNVSVYGWAVLEDRAGRVWYGDKDSGWVRRGQKEFEKVPLQPTGATGVRALFEDSRGRVWLGTQGGAVVFDAERSESPGPEVGLPRRGIACFGEDSTGSVWVAQANGVFRQTGDRFTAILATDGQPLQGVSCFHAEPDGTVWLGTRAAALLRWRQGELARIGVAEGLPACELRGILDDGRGHLWISSNRGVIRANRAQLHAAAAGSGILSDIQLLDENDGLPSPECSVTQPGCVRDAAGRLWFATQKGVAVTDPAEFRPNALPPPVRVEQLSYLEPGSGNDGPGGPGLLSATEVSLAAPFPVPLRLPPGIDGLRIEFAALSLTVPEKVRFQFRLGRDGGDWQDVGNDRVVRLHQLPPGDYLFVVRAANNDGVWNQAGDSLTFSVLPHFWQTWWFRFVIGAGLVALGGMTVWSWFHRKTAHALERERVVHEMRELRESLAHSDRVSAMAQFATGLAHELGQPLGAILRNAEAAEMLIEEDPPDMEEIRAILADIRQDDQRAAGVIQRLRAMLRRQAAERTRLFVAELLRDTVGLAGPNARQHQVQLAVEGLDGLPPVWGDRVQLQQVLLNLLLNGIAAMRQLPPESRRLTLKAHLAAEGKVQIMVQDTGPGIAPENLGRVFEPFFSTTPDGMGIGLAISKTIVESHGGRIWVEQAPGGGACFVFTLPVATGDGPAKPADGRGLG